MLKKASYRNVLSPKWLFSISVVFSLIALPGFISTTEACNPQPQHVEVLLSGEDHNESAPFSYYPAFVSDWTSGSPRRAREYEVKIQFAHQSRIKEALFTIAVRSYNFSPPVFFRNVKTISVSRDDIPPLVAGYAIT